MESQSVDNVSFKKQLDLNSMLILNALSNNNNNNNNSTTSTANSTGNTNNHSNGGIHSSTHSNLYHQHLNNHNTATWANLLNSNPGNLLVHLPPSSSSPLPPPSSNIELNALRDAIFPHSSFDIHHLLNDSSKTLPPGLMIVM